MRNFKKMSFFYDAYDKNAKKSDKKLYVVICFAYLSQHNEKNMKNDIDKILLFC